MELDLVLNWVGQIHLTQWGNAEQAAKLIGELADYRASQRGDESANFADVHNMLFKLCDWWPWKPQDWKAVMAELRPLLLSDDKGIEIAKRALSAEFISLEYSDAIEMFRDRLSFFAPDGDMQVIDTSVTEPLGIRVPHEGRAFRPRPLRPMGGQSSHFRPVIVLEDLNEDWRKKLEILKKTDYEHSE